MIGQCTKWINWANSVQSDFAQSGFGPIFCFDSTLGHSTSPPSPPTTADVWDWLRGMVATQVICTLLSWTPPSLSPRDSLASTKSMNALCRGPGDEPGSGSPASSRVSNCWVW